jgi:hypothetical protein
VLVIDPAGRVLLLEGFDPAEPDRRYWFTIGGGLNDGEETAHGGVGDASTRPGSATTGDTCLSPWNRWAGCGHHGNHDRLRHRPE